MWVVPLLASFFTFFADFIAKIFGYFSKTIFFVKSITLNTAVKVALGAFVGAIIKLMYNLYNFVTDTMETILNTVYSPTGELLNIAFAVLKSIGFFEAFLNTWKLFSPLIFAFFSLIMLKIVFIVAENAADRFHKTAGFINNGEADKGGWFKRLKGIFKKG
ncbi:MULTISPECIES: hypothetical protein [unclassified Campylobacter]|uniref:hypothetical protein n=1 Tax=unclassified Campylobacter TaxID=2593542 RepID=UPI0022E9F703|nr:MULTISPECIES: hypothetical protein [unclassified Campylobacter]MBR6953065.1 hypothetical protein [Campylobacter sp.]MDA3080629.1 hypothetical protein [Campylobacter sp. CS_NA1]MDA3085166.1 hypothetical protein [Campylobacter sp. CS_ED1]MDA3089943.1 hypothetical protein [Campylobacter sp. CS_ED2]